VRSAALAALFDSSDPATIPVVDRARDNQGLSLLPDPPPDPEGLGLSLPPGAEPLRFADDAKDGVIAFLSEQSSEAVLQYYEPLVRRPFVTLGALKSVLLPDWAKVGGMGFYQQLGERLQDLGNLPMDQQLLAQLRMAQLMVMVQQGALPEEIERWRDSKLWGEVRASVLAVDPLLEMPSQLLLVYEDRQLGRTGFAVQWLPAFSLPATPTPATEAAVVEPPLDAAEVEALIWRAVVWRGQAADYKAYLTAFPAGAHAEDARAALQRIESDAAQNQQEQPADLTAPQAGTPATPTIAGETVAATSDDGVTLSATSPLLPLTPIVVAFRGLDPARSPWLTVVAAGMPDTQWTDWAYANAAEGSVTLPGQRAGDYEIRALLEAPREVVARLAVTVVSTATGPPALALAGEAPRASQPILVRFSNLPGDPSDWISVVKAGAPDTRWDDWTYTRGKTEGEITLKGQPAGDYELRVYTERPKREVLVRLPLTILP
jgi:hypothetical protein